jgi:hypothetical protein
MMHILQAKLLVRLQFYHSTVSFRLSSIG